MIPLTPNVGLPLRFSAVSRDHEPELFKANFLAHVSYNAVLSIAEKAVEKMVTVKRDEERKRTIYTIDVVVLTREQLEKIVIDSYFAGVGDGMECRHS